ncbi:hypothetical protein [Rhizobium grahamii]|uniref:Uncharacterized protein n=1 Tax=Rhizobium grahamii TaxID=1120045 RepID=A0A370KE64_9HYPH|nr:hypothetical protein [Rhizobium grahamii]RDJ01876.1 hypothetical protein B5K06_33385 [Rhizobium grahamii]
MTLHTGPNGEVVNVPKPGAELLEWAASHHFDVSQNTWVLNVSGPAEPGLHPIAETVASSEPSSDWWHF